MRSINLICARGALLDNRGPSCRRSGACAALSTPVCLFWRASVSVSRRGGVCCQHSAAVAGAKVYTGNDVLRTVCGRTALRDLGDRGQSCKTNWEEAPHRGLCYSEGCECKYLDRVVSALVERQGA